ncbi:hypothetical protein STEG23_032130, partial [Scotinomys teguina]
TPLLVRRSSDPVPGPHADAQPSAASLSGQSLKPVVPDSTQNWEDREVMNGEHTELLSSHRMKDALSDMTRTVEISGEGDPLGIQVVPFFSSLSGRILGLFIRGIEENSRCKQEGLFQENECIVKINNVELLDKTFAQAQDVFRQAMKSPSVVLHVLLPQNRERYEKSVIRPLNIFGNNDGTLSAKVPPPARGKPGLTAANLPRSNGPEAVESSSLQQSKSPQVPRRERKPSSPSLSPFIGFGSKKNAKKIKIDLKKGKREKHGITEGDGEVNGKDVTGRTQEELVAMLRSTKQGETVSLVIARQEESFLPREL